MAANAEGPPTQSANRRHGGLRASVAFSEGGRPAAISVGDVSATVHCTGAAQSARLRLGALQVDDMAAPAPAYPVPLLGVPPGAEGAAPPGPVLAVAVERSLTRAKGAVYLRAARWAPWRSGCGATESPFPRVCPLARPSVVGGNPGWSGLVEVSFQTTNHLPKSFHP